MARTFTGHGGKATIGGVSFSIKGWSMTTKDQVLTPLPAWSSAPQLAAFLPHFTFTDTLANGCAPFAACLDWLAERDATLDEVVYWYSAGPDMGWLWETHEEDERRRRVLAEWVRLKMPLAVAPLDRRDMGKAAATQMLLADAVELPTLDVPYATTRVLAEYREGSAPHAAACDSVRSSRLHLKRQVLGLFPGVRAVVPTTLAGKPIREEGGRLKVTQKTADEWIHPQLIEIERLGERLGEFRSHYESDWPATSAEPDPPTLPVLAVRDGEARLELIRRSVFLDEAIGSEFWHHMNIGPQSHDCSPPVVLCSCGTRPAVRHVDASQVSVCNVAPLLPMQALAYRETLPSGRVRLTRYWFVQCKECFTVYWSMQDVPESTPRGIINLNMPGR